MDSDTIEKMFLAIMRSIGGIDEKLKHVPTHADVFQAIDAHRMACSRRPSIEPKKTSGMLLKALVGALVALTGTVVALTQLL